MTTCSLLFFISILLPWLILLAAEAVSPDGIIPITRPGCRESCENSTVKIPYPFGIGHGCYHSPWFEIVCNSSSSKPFLSKYHLEVVNVSSCLGTTSNDICTVEDLYLEVAGPRTKVCTNPAGSVQQMISVARDLEGSPFWFSDRNAFVLLGGSARVLLMNRSGDLLGDCSTAPSVNPVTPLGSNITNKIPCYGVGCCYVVLPKYSDFFRANLSFDSCIEIALMEADTSADIAVQLSRSTDSFRSLLFWNPPPLLHNGSDGIICKSHCETGYRCLQLCRCVDGFIGNPYIPYGCQAVQIPCEPRSFFHCKRQLMTGSAIGLETAVLLLGFYGLYRLIKRQMKIKQRTKFFKRNGGLLLQQQMTSTGVVERTAVFSEGELEKATDNFNTNRILGHGGQGTVYKGMLPDGRVVAVKKAKRVDEGQLEQFINELVILSQINHRNVVRLLGCCLETEVPLLVYEFIPNGALSQHIHNSSEDFNLSWEMRLQIAVESAWAIAYLHSSSATPIYHRDIKSSNILLDERYRAKVSDFGTSRTIDIDQTHLSIRVQGTFGYLDPEYFRSNQFTEKSDVYSFGVVLVELLTGKRPLLQTESGECTSLAVEFISKMERSCLVDMLDARIVAEANKEELMAVANLASRCLSISPKQRPNMKEVATALDGIRSPGNPPSTIEQTHLNDYDVIVEMGYPSSDNTTPTSFFHSDNGFRSGTSYSAEIRPLEHNTV